MTKIRTGERRHWEIISKSTGHSVLKQLPQLLTIRTFCCLIMKGTTQIDTMRDSFPSQFSHLHDHPTSTNESYSLQHKHKRTAMQNHQTFLMHAKILNSSPQDTHTFHPIPCLPTNTAVSTPRNSTRSSYPRYLPSFSVPSTTDTSAPVLVAGHRLPRNRVDRRLVAATYLQLHMPMNMHQPIDIALRLIIPIFDQQSRKLVLRAI
jgi:hypothetical protein